jgi:hypothetical protein
MAGFEIATRSFLRDAGITVRLPGRWGCSEHCTHAGYTLLRQCLALTAWHWSEWFCFGDGGAAFQKRWSVAVGQGRLDVTRYLRRVL